MTSSWATLAAGATADVMLRIIGNSGDGVTDPQFGRIDIQVR
jgi:hypothetical protein